MPAKTVPFREEDYQLFLNEFNKLGVGYAVLFAVGCHTPYRLCAMLNSSVSDFIYDVDKNGDVQCRKELNLDKELNIEGDTTVIIPENVVMLISRYLNGRLSERRSRKMEDYTFKYEPMFLTSTEQLISYSGFGKMLYRIKIKNGITEDYAIHSMRKTYYRKMCDAAGIHATAKFMKRSVSQAMDYLGVNNIQ